MMTAPYPTDELERLDLLDRLDLLSDKRDEFLDAITIVMSRTFRVPIALISLIDRDRQFFKSSAGMDVRETSRDCSFCAHILCWPKPMVVQDPAADARFHDNPLVTGSPGIRFYAGVPIFLRGVCLGTLCLIDTRQRSHLDSNELRCLVGAGMAVEERLIQMAGQTNRIARTTK